MAFKANKNWLLLGAAVLLGIGAVYLSNDLLKSRMAQLEEEAKRGQELVPVVVASRDLERGDTITSDVMSVRKVPKDFVHHTAVTPQRFNEFENQRLAAPLKRGEALLETYTEGQGNAVFSATLKKGWRALTFEVDTVNSISGMLRPGDHIDLIYTAKAPGNDKQELTAPLLSDVTVLATGQTRTKRDEVDGKERSFSAVTMELAPRDADRVIVAKNAGRLTAVLRHPDDHAANDTRGMTADSLLLGGPVAANQRMIEFIGGPPASVVAVGANAADMALRQ